jgi:hypothetical protein
MTMSRALDELVAAELGESTAFGRERHLRLAGSKQKVWEKAQPLLQDPVMKRHAIRSGPNTALPGPRSGLGALAHFSMLAEPKNVALALDRKSWKALQKKNDASLRTDLVC